MEKEAGFSLIEVLISLFLITSFSACLVHHQIQQAGLLSQTRQIFKANYAQWNQKEHA